VREVLVGLVSRLVGASISALADTIAASTPLGIAIRSSATGRFSGMVVLVWHHERRDLGQPRPAAFRFPPSRARTPRGRVCGRGFTRLPWLLAQSRLVLLHADAGVAVEVLRELMSHRKLETTGGYYRVGQTRRREAVDRVAAMQFDRYGNRIWRQAQALLDSEHARRAIGEVAVPFGVCAEPSNVKAGGGACPFRFRCAGCDHFRTDVSYLPDLQAYLDDLLRTRERLLATTDLDQWAHAEAMPSEEEITRIRRLIARIRAGLDELAPQDREHVEQAVTVVRRHRSVMLGMPRIRQTLPDLRPRTVRGRSPDRRKV